MEIKPSDGDPYLEHKPTGGEPLGVNKTSDENPLVENRLPVGDLPVENKPTGGESLDVFYMKQALLLSKETLERREVPIACIIVYKNGDVIARGSNDVNRTKNATRFAEIIAIEQVRRYAELNLIPVNEVFRDSTLYVTTEPCIMCAAALRLVGLTNVVYGCGNQRFGGCGSRLDVHSRVVKNLSSSPELQSNGKNELRQNEHTKTGESPPSSPYSKRTKLDYENVEVSGDCLVAMGPPLNCRSGIMATEAIDMLKMFYAGENPNAPNPKDKSGRREKLLLQHKEK